MARSDPLAGARIPQDAFEVLEAAAYVRRLKMQALLAPVLQAFADDLRKDPAVRTAIRAREERDAVTQGKLQPLRRTQGGGRPD